MVKIRLITISRDFGTDIDEIINKISKKVYGEILDRKRIHEELALEGYDVQELENKEKELEKGVRDPNFIETYKEHVRRIVKKYIEKDSIIFLLGRGGQFLFKDENYSFHINVIAPLSYRIKFLTNKFLLSEEKALELIREKDFSREIFYNTVFLNSWKEPSLYHLIIDRSFFTAEEIEAIIEKVIERQESKIYTPEQLSLPQKPKFANKTEEEFAKILTFYQIRWEYEPRTFPLEWDNDGNVVESFTPDFYLPDFDLYIELTLQRPRVMGEKLKKIKKLKNLYPDIKIKLFYGKEYEKLLSKYGIKEIK